MEKSLADINAVAGVQSSFTCDNRGEVIASATPADPNTAVLNNIGRQVTLTLAALETTGEAMSELDLTYEGARLVARDLGNAVLVVLCEPQVEIAMLRLTLNVVTARWKKDPGVQEQLTGRAGEREDLLAKENLGALAWLLLGSLGEPTATPTEAGEASRPDGEAREPSGIGTEAVEAIPHRKVG
jgi:predicted regulator of Ras-like GTPase activity (Roadblock/LC7/MglB family)